MVICLDQTDTRFVEQCLSRGIHYVDISADYGFLSEVEKLDELAKQNGATAMLSVGVAPGLTNMLAARARERMERVAYRFNFSDQHVIGRTLDVPAVSTWVRFDDRVSTWLFAKSSQLGLGRLLRRRWWRKIAVWLFLNVHMGSDICAVAARATGRTKDGAQTLTLGLVGRKEALMTAIVAAETARQVLSGKPVPGVLHSERAIALDPVVSALRMDQPNLVVAL